MAEVNELLNQVWSAFRKAGITDDLEIIGYVAALLLHQTNKYNDDLDLPTLPKQTSDLALGEIHNKLSETLEEVSAGELFDRYVLVRLPEMLKGGRYITPRHVVEFMLNLADIQPESTLADFACGSGAFLIHATTTQASKVGVEISPEWARLARANLLLHNQTNAEIFTGNSLRLIQTTSALAAEQFDRVVMNPPFGERVDASFLEDVFEQSIGSRSETAFNALTLYKLNAGGRAALLVPTGVLFGNSKGEQWLRETLIEQNHLEAVITLPNNAFQPYSAIDTHLLLIHKTVVDDPALTWFLRPEFDGYREGRGRDLTRPAETHNDLHFVERIIEFIRNDRGVVEDDSLLKVQTVTENDNVYGFYVQPTDNVVINHARLLPSLENDPDLILLQVQFEDSQEYWSFALDGGVLVKVDDAEKLIRKRLNLTKNASIPQPDIFQNQGISSDGKPFTAGETIGERLVITANGQLFGVAVSRQVIRERYYGLEPDRYVRAPVIEVERRPPHEILHDIQDNQQVLSQRVYRLLGWVSPEPAPEISLPSPILTEIDSDDIVTPFGSLSADQAVVWELVKAQIDPIEGQELSTGKYFTSLVLMEQAEAAITEECIELTLDILEGMGLIIPVTQPNPIDSGSPPMSFYRLIEKRDIWRFDLTPEEGDE